MIFRRLLATILEQATAEEHIQYALDNLKDAPHIKQDDGNGDQYSRRDEQKRECYDLTQDVRIASPIFANDLV